jgi:NTE family protein
VSGQGRDARGAALASYLLFESSYTRELMALGERDTEARRDEVLQFFRWQPRAAHSAQAAQHAETANENAPQVTAGR